MGLFSKLFKDNGHQYERKVARNIGRKVDITSRNKEYFKNGKRFWEIDIETRSSAIEVKSGQGKGLQKQLDKYSIVTKKEPVALAPNMKYEAKKQTRRKYKVFDSTKELRNYLLSKGDGKKGKK